MSTKGRSDIRHGQFQTSDTSHLNVMSTFQLLRDRHLASSFVSVPTYLISSVALLELRAGAARCVALSSALLGYSTNGRSKINGTIVGMRKVRMVEDNARRQCGRIHITYDECTATQTH